MRPGVDRFVTRSEGRTTWHSFSFGSHYDPGNVGFGPLFALNDEQLPPGTGYSPHRHVEVEIVSWVRSGELRHSSELGERALPRGSVQRLSAGRGVTHSEVADGPAGTRFLQAWLRPDRSDRPPSYESAAAPLSAAWTCLVSGDGGGLVSVDIAGAALHAVRLEEAQRVDLPEAPLLHVFVTEGSVQLGERTLEADDAARLTDEAGRTLTGSSPAEVLVWSFDRPRG